MSKYRQPGRGHVSEEERARWEEKLAADNMPEELGEDEGKTALLREMLGEELYRTLYETLAHDTAFSGHELDKTHREIARDLGIPLNDETAPLIDALKNEAERHVVEARKIAAHAKPGTDKRREITQLFPNMSRSLVSDIIKGTEHKDAA